MKKKIFAGLTGVLLLVLMVGLVNVFAQGNNEKPDEQETDNKPKSENVKKDEGQADDQAQRQINVSESFAEAISKANEIVRSKSDDPRLQKTDNDEGFNYYLNSKKADKILAKGRSENDNFSESLQKDLSNLFKMKAAIGHSQFVRTSEFGKQGQGKEDVSHSDQWKPVDEDFKKAGEYMKQILHDLDVAVNKNGKGETYGVTHTLNGDKADEVDNVFESNQPDNK